MSRLCEGRCNVRGRTHSFQTDEVTSNVHRTQQNSLTGVLCHTNLTPLQSPVSLHWKQDIFYIHRRLPFGRGSLLTFQQTVVTTVTHECTDNCPPDVPCRRYNEGVRPTTPLRSYNKNGDRRGLDLRRHPVPKRMIVHIGVEEPDPDCVLSHTQPPPPTLIYLLKDCYLPRFNNSNSFMRDAEGVPPHRFPSKIVN